MIYTVTLNPAIDREYQTGSIEMNTVLRAAAVRDDPGGKGFNVSRMLSVFGANSKALGFVGGKSGEWLTDNLNQRGIETDFVWLDGETRTNTTIVTDLGHDYIKVNGAGPFVTQQAQDALCEKIKGLAEPNSLWVLAGSLPPGVDIGFYGLLIDLIRAEGGTVFLDTSGPALAAGIQHKPDWIKPNESEVKGLTGQTDLSLSLSDIRDWSIPHIVISLGADGALIDVENQAWRLKPPLIEEKNPIGAGDAMVGGIVWALSQNMGPLEACRWGMACGALAASKAGTAFGSRSEVEALYPLIMEPVPA